MLLKINNNILFWCAYFLLGDKYEKNFIIFIYIPFNAGCLCG